MYIVDGIAYAGEQDPTIRISGIRPMKDHRLWLRFSTGECGIFDFTPLLKDQAFQPLNETSVFEDVYIDYGVPVWKNGEIDIDPKYLYDRAEMQNEQSA